MNRDGSRFASGHADSRVRVWDTRRGQEIASLAVPTSRVAPILSIALSGDGRTLAAAEPGGTVVCWDMEKKEVIGRWAGQSYPARLGLDEAGRHLLVVGDTESELWSLAPGLKRIWQGEGGAGGALNPAGNRLAVTLGKVPRTEVRDIETGRLVHTLPATRQGYSSLLFSADGRHLATWSYEDGFQIWDMKTGAALAATQNIRVNFPSHVGLAFRPDGRALAINPGDAIWLWHWASGREERLVSRTTGLLPLSFSADGRRLLTAEKAGLRSGAFLQVREWLIEPDDLVQAARKQIDRPMTPEQCMQYFGRAQCPPLP